VKGRAQHQEQDNALGFSKHAKDFIESWLNVAKSMANGDSNSPLFPYYSKDGQIKLYSEIGSSPHARGESRILQPAMCSLFPAHRHAAQHLP
ncbi:hypothetical protein O5824_27205, partial [Escherichia coli]|nr:hypothetical protein [Escherichia coli]